MYAERRCSSDNMSARSSDSDGSNVSGLSRASSASRLSSTSYMSIQSERPRGRLRSVFVGPGSNALFVQSFISSLSIFLASLHANCCLCFICMPTAACCSLLHVQSQLSSHTYTHTHVTMHTMNLGNGFANTFAELRSKSLEEEKKDRRISWGVNGEEERRRATGKRRFSEELKRRRHTVAGDARDSR